MSMTDTFRRTLIAVNNAIAGRRRTRVSPDGLLLLAPHCLQRSGCPHRVTDDLAACALCGACDVAGLLGLCREYGIGGYVVGGGRRALEMARSPAVKAVVAVACERELCAGIRAAFPKPVWAIVNRRPNGPCRDTAVEVAEVRAAIEMFLGKGGAE